MVPAATVEAEEEDKDEDGASDDMADDEAEEEEGGGWCRGTKGPLPWLHARKGSAGETPACVMWCGVRGETNVRAGRICYCTSLRMERREIWPGRLNPPPKCSKATTSHNTLIHL